MFVCLHCKDKLTVQTESMYVSKFTCTCGMKYIRQTVKQLSEGVKEFYPAILREKSTVKCINSVIFQHD